MKDDILNNGTKPLTQRENHYRNDGVVVYESSSSQIVRRHINVNETNCVDFIPDLQSGRVEVAVKSLTHPCPSYEDVSHLNNEYHILTRHLANCSSSVRRALGCMVAKPTSQITSTDDDRRLSRPPDIQHGIYLEWIEGITLEDFIKQLQSSEKKTDNLFIVQLMHKIALALAEIHEAGVIHNDIAVDNIIIDINTSDGGEENKENSASLSSVSTKIIDFGYASTIAMAETDDSGETINDDLYNLGKVYREVLLAFYPSNTHRSSLTRNSISCTGDDILPDSTPSSLHSVVSCLTNCKNDDASSCPPYKSAKEVVEDLEQMINDPEIFLYGHHGENSKTPCLFFKTDALYGRSAEVKKLLDAYDQICHGKNSSDKVHDVCSDMILVTGYGGSGKTTLVQSLKGPVIRSGGYFISGKFDAIQRNEPYSALIKAFSDLCSAILASDDAVVEKTRQGIMSAVGSEVMVLTQVIPKLGKIITSSDKEGQGESQNVFTSGLKSQNKLHFAFRRFMRAIATSEHPLVMVLDDLQWADTSSLSLIQTIITDSENKSPLLLVGCYRDNEVREDHPLLTTIHDIERLKFTSLNRKLDAIRIDSLEQEDLNLMISDALLMKRRVTRKGLTDLVYHKTHGNALFSVQFLKSLVEDGLLFFQPESNRWNWNEDGINKKDISNSVGDLLAHKIRTQLTENARNTLRLAACIGSSFEVEILAMVVDVTAKSSLCSVSKQVESQNHCDDLAVKCETVSKILNQLVCEGLLEDDDGSKIKFRFVHDRIYQAAYACTPEDERPTMHLLIGELMQKMLNHQKKRQQTSHNDNSMLFRITDQLNRGSHLITDKSKKLAMADLNLRVGEICMKKSAFQSALSHLEAGMRLIDRDICWQEHYELVLRLHNITSEAQYCTGNLNDTPKLLEDVFANAKSFEDKLKAYSTQMLVLGAQLKTKDAISVGLGVLAAMGEGFPTSISKRTIFTEIMKTKWMLKRKEADLMELPLMKDKIKITAMQFLSTIIMNCFIADPLLFPLVACRMIRLTISHGICEASGFSFASFGYILTNRLRFTKEGYKYGQVALSLTKRCGGKEWLAKVYAGVYSGINYWSENLSLCTEAAFEGYKIGMEVGDLMYVSSCAVIHLRHLLFCGVSLELAENRARTFCHQLAEFNQGLGLNWCISAWQTMLNLLGKSENPDELAGEAIRFGASQSAGSSQSKKFDEATFSFFEMYLAYMFGQITVAAEKSKAIKKLLSETTKQFQTCMRYNVFFYDGLVSIDMARSTKSKYWKKEAKRTMKRLKKQRKYHLKIIFLCMS